MKLLTNLGKSSVYKQKQRFSRTKILQLKHSVSQEEFQRPIILTYLIEIESLNACLLEWIPDLLKLDTESP